jgi:membrane-bound serine protease (ClpP class)
LTLAAVSGLFVFAIVRMAVQARRRQVVSGEQALIGASGEVVSDLSDEGWASIQGEIWRVRSALPLAQGQRVRVKGIDGPTLVVEPQPDQSKGVTS